jgi:hypothetical protein
MKDEGALGFLMDLGGVEEVVEGVEDESAETTEVNGDFCTVLRRQKCF